MMDQVGMDGLSVGRLAGSRPFTESMVTVLALRIRK